ncbi:PGPGW domain-containing protein [Euzebya sp.]|uniref:PGPGW domain-containing protein n=1 Tax=Euzebya sp. TaxID=1971409 RepID=UPI00351538C7
MTHPDPHRGQRTLSRWVGLALRRTVVTVVGAVVLAAGIVMILTPGPGLVGIIAGLAILGTEYDWAARARDAARRRSKAAYAQARSKVQQRRDRRAGDGTPRGTGLS